MTASTTPEKTHPLNHLAIIPDGNTRWAKQNDEPIVEGYRRGVQRGVEMARHVRELGIHTVTFWGLSTENWRNRPPRELTFLVKMMRSLIRDYLSDAMESDVKIVHLGRDDRLPEALLKEISAAEEKTKNNGSYILNMALDYGGQDELERAAQAYSESEDEDKKFEDFLDTAGQPYPNPDFIIRTSGEQRTSGLMPWGSTYAELYFEPCYWPDFTTEKLDEAVENYYSRQRRFGGGH